MRHLKQLGQTSVKSKTTYQKCRFQGYGSNRLEIDQRIVCKAKTIFTRKHLSWIGHKYFHNQNMEYVRYTSMGH